MAETTSVEGVIQLSSVEARTLVGHPTEQHQVEETQVSDDGIENLTTGATTRVGHPTEQLQVEETQVSDDGIEYPTGIKLWLTIISVCITGFLKGLDLTIVAVAVPSLTDEFKTVADIGWYNAAYGLTLSAFVFFFGKACQVFRIKSVFILGIIIFEIGSLICTVATSSKMFVVGRGIAGLGSSAIGGCLIKLLRHLFPLSKQAMWTGVIGGFQSVGLVIAPLIGGVLIDRFGWRACFGINLPLGVLCLAFTIYGFVDPVTNEDLNLPWTTKLNRINPFGTLLVVPAIVCFLMALQWGGTTYGWKDWRIIFMFVLFGVLFTAFGYLQYRQGEEATVPLRILKQRSILAGLWYAACGDGTLAVTEYYISIYFQGVRGLSASKSGLLGVPMIVGLMVSVLVAAAGISRIGYYYPFMYATSVLAPIASGLLTTIDLDGSVVKASALLGFLGIAIGLGIQGPTLAVQATLPAKDVSIGGAVAVFGAGMGSALFVSASSTLFHNRLTVEIQKFAAGTNGTAIANVGLSDLRNYIGRDRLKEVLSGYNAAVVQTLYLPLALGVLSIVGSVAMERRSLKKKQS